MIFIGIDPGATGGIVAIRENLSIVLAWTADGKGGTDGYYLAGEPDVLAISARLRPMREEGVRSVVIEEPLGLGRIGTSVALTIGRCWGMTFAAVLAARLPVRRVSPAKWSADLFRGKKGVTTKEKKDIAVRLVMERLPELQLVLPGCRVPHTGLADAACLALWAMRAP